MKSGKQGDHMIKTRHLIELIETIIRPFSAISVTYREEIIKRLWERDELRKEMEELKSSKPKA